MLMKPNIETVRGTKKFPAMEKFLRLLSKPNYSFRNCLCLSFSVYARHTSVFSHALFLYSATSTNSMLTLPKVDSPIYCLKHSSPF